mmetsp:Transcript_9520/g.27324  ORF Transcript_9520/g.27324 Transcript_9520/m.27324 type:complete len:300 (-) Transcript_9520:134-1033(-)
MSRRTRMVEKTDPAPRPHLVLELTKDHAHGEQTPKRFGRSCLRAAFNADAPLVLNEPMGYRNNLHSPHAVGGTIESASRRCKRGSGTPWHGMRRDTSGCNGASCNTSRRNGMCGARCRKRTRRTPSPAPSPRRQRPPSASRVQRHRRLLVQTPAVGPQGVSHWSSASSRHAPLAVPAPRARCPCSPRAARPLAFSRQRRSRTRTWVQQRRQSSAETPAARWKRTMQTSGPLRRAAPEGPSIRAQCHRPRLRGCPRRRRPLPMPPCRRPWRRRARMSAEWQHGHRRLSLAPRWFDPPNVL